MTFKKNLLIFFVIFFSNILLCYAEIKMIQVTIRHADRNPPSNSGGLSSFYYPNDPYKDFNWTPDGPMELTNKGKRNAFKLGKFLRDRYGSLIGLTYKPNRVYFHAAQMNRAITTAQLVAAGMFPPTDEQIWNSKLLWIPIPIYFQPIDEDMLNYSLAFCENYRIDRLKSNDEVNRLFGAVSDIQTLFNFLSLHTGANYTSSTQGWLLYHQLASQYAERNGFDIQVIIGLKSKNFYHADKGLELKLEPWTETIFPNGRLVDISAVEYILQTYTERMKRLLGGIWIKIFLDHIDDLLTGKNDQYRGYFYTSNEIQIAAILNTLGVYKPHVPGYTSAVIFELHEIDQKSYVKVIYRNEENLTEFTIPGCENSLCPLSSFKSALKNVTLHNFNEDCGNRLAFSILSTNISRSSLT